MGCVKVNVEDLKTLQGKLENIDTNSLLESCAKELAARLLRMVKQRTPVGQYPSGSGKVGGTLRRGWNSDNFQISSSNKEYTITIINPTEYASYVEYGHRTANHSGWVPGRFMLTISEEELKRTAPAIVEKKVRQWLKGTLQ